MQYARRLFPLLFLFSCLLARAQAPTWQWVKCGTTPYPINSITNDAWGNVYLTASNTDSLLIKCDPSGNIIWTRGAKVFDTTGFNNNAASIGYKGVCTDQSGNIYTIGSFVGAFMVIGIDTFSNLYSSFLTKYDSSGNVLWVQILGKTLNNGVVGATAISTDRTGNVHITGWYETGVSFGNISLSGGSVFIVKYNPAGEVVWANSSINNGDAAGLGIACDSMGNSYITGYSASITFGNISLSNTFPPGGNAFTVKYDTGGNVVWATAPLGGNIGSIESTGIAVDNRENVYITGTYSGTPDGGVPYIIIGHDTLISPWNATADIFIVKYDSNGNVSWTKTPGGNESEVDICGLALNTDIYGNLYVLGSSFNITTTDNNSAEIIFGTDSINMGSENSPEGFFIIKFDGSGGPVWITAAGKSTNYNNLAAPNAVAKTMAIDNRGAIYVTGDIEEGSSLFDNDTVTVASNAYYFLGKLDTNILRVATHTNNLAVEADILVYPNPNSVGNWQLTVSNDLLGSRIELYDVEGRLVFHSAISNQKSEIGLAGLAAGIYFLSIVPPVATSGGGAPVVRKLVKM